VKGVTGILIIESDPEDALLIKTFIREGMSEGIEIDHASTLEEMFLLLDTRGYDILLLDYFLGPLEGLEVMRRIRDHGITAPMILLTGQGDEEIAVSVMREGASDYLSKKKLSSDLICHAIRYSLELHRTEILRRKIESALQEREESYRTIINTASEGFWVFDVDLKTLDVNQSLCQMLGYTREEIFKKKASEFVSNNDRKVFEGRIHMISSTQNAFETIFQTKEGKDLHVILNASIIRHKTGTPARIFSFITDITKLKQAEEALKQGNEALKKLDQMKSEFISTVSHELRTPLTSIKNAVSLLIKGKTGPLNEAQARFLEMAGRNIDRLSILLDDILDLSKLESNKLDFHPRELIIHHVMQHMTATFQAQADESAITLKINCQKNLPSVYSDPEKIEQIFCNLVSNAIKFTPKGGNVTLSAKPRDGMVEVSVADTGVGISIEEQNHVFDRFYQIGNTLSNTTKGTGLGLSIAKELVKAQGGGIGVESKAGKGSRFFFTLSSFSPQTLEMATLEKIIRTFRNYPTFSILLVVPGDDRAFYKGESCKELLDQTAGIARECLPRASDLIINQPAFSRLVVVFQPASAQEAILVKGKLDRAFSQSTIVYKRNLITRPNILGPVTYPDDGVTGKDLIARAKKQYEGA